MLVWSWLYCRGAWAGHARTGLYPDIRAIDILEGTMAFNLLPETYRTQIALILYIMNILEDICGPTKIKHIHIVEKTNNQPLMLYLITIQPC